LETLKKFQVISDVCQRGSQRLLKNVAKTKDEAGFEVIERTIDELIDVTRKMLDDIRNNDGNSKFFLSLINIK